MKNFTIAFLVFIIWSFFGLWFYHWLQADAITKKGTAENAEVVAETTAQEFQKKGLLYNENSEVLESPEIENTNELETGLTATTEQGDLLFIYPENFIIEKNSAQVSIPESSKDFKYKLNGYLLEHPETELVIISKYSAEENIETPNYGEQRAQKVKSVLIAAGIKANRIVIKPHITPIQFKSDKSNNNAFSFSIQPLDLLRLENIKKEIPETQTIYPNFSSSGVLNSPILETMLQKVKEALEANPNLLVTVIGHTDNVGSAIDNHKRGLDFARQLRWYFISKGNLDKAKIKAMSEGESKAIASNQTEKGRNLNQRIEIKFSEE